MESIKEFIEKSLLTVDLNTVTKAKLKQMYLKEHGIAKLSKEEKKLFSTAIESACIDFLKKESSSEEEVIKDYKVEVNDCKSDSESVSSDVADDPSRDSGLSVSHKESLEAVEVRLTENKGILTNDNESLNVHNCAEISEYDSFHDSSKSLEKVSADFPSGNIDNDSVIKEEQVVDTSGELDDETLMSKEYITKNYVSNESLIKEKKQEPVANTSGESDNEPLMSKKEGTENCVSNKFSSDSEDEPLVKERKEKPVADTSGESDDEPLIAKKAVTKNSGSSSLSSDSDDKPLIEENKKHLKEIQFNANVCDSNDDPISKATYLNSSDSEEELLVNVKKNLEKKVSSESEEEFLISKKSKKLQNTVNRPKKLEDQDMESNKDKKKPVLSDSGEEELLPTKKAKRQKKSLSGNTKNSKNKVPSKLNNQKPKPLRRIQKSFMDSSDSEDLPLISVKVKTNPKNSLENSSREETREIGNKNSNRKILGDSEELPLISVKAQNNPKNSHGEARKIGKEDSNRKILSDSDNESPVPTVKRKRSLKRKSNLSNDGSDKHGASSSDSDEPLSSFKIKPQMQKSVSKYTSDKTNNKVDNNKQPIKHNLKKKKNSKKDSDISLADDDSDEYMLPATKKTKFSNTLSSSNVSDSDEEPLASLSKNKSSKKISLSGSNVSDSDDEPLVPLSKNKSSKKISLSSSDVSDSDDEPLTSFSKNKSSKKISPTQSIINEKNKSSENNISQLSTHKIDTSDTDEEPLSKKNVKVAAKPKISAKRKKSESNSDESEAPIAKKSKTKSDVKKEAKKPVAQSSDSEDEPLASISKSNTENNEDSSMDENEESPIAKSTLKGATKVNKTKGQKKQTPSEGKLENLKKYIRAAGIYIKSYDKLFENCKSMKSKSEKLLHLLEKEGLKGRPSLVKCKKLKKKIETKKEVAELDPSNIISSGRPKRKACSDTTNYINDNEDSDVPLAKYSRLKGIIDSEESD